METRGGQLAMDAFAWSFWVGGYVSEKEGEGGIVVDGWKG